MSAPSFMQKTVNYIYKHFAGNIGKMLLWTGALGWILSSLAQATGVMFNKKIPNDQKKFLIPQELADAAVNILSFIIVTKSVTKIGENLVSSGKLATPKIREFLTKYKLDPKVCTKGFNIAKEAQLNELDPKFDKEFQKAYYKFFDGVSFIASTVGSVISCNIITPILRNKFAAYRQKQDIAKDKIQKDDNMSAYEPILPAQNTIGKDNYRTVIAKVPSNGSMRV